MEELRISNLWCATCPSDKIEQSVEVVLSLQAGDVIERYEVESRIGSGGMASVYRVRHRMLGSLHALKVLHPRLLHDDEIRDRFLAEGRIQAQLFHPYIAAVTDLVSAQGVAGLVMEYLQGEGLDVRIDRDGALSVAEAGEVMVPVLAAVAHAHQAGVVHRDLKPSNIFLCSRTRGMVRPVVLDFGIAKITQASELSGFKERRTVAGTRMGTVNYMSPEQIRCAAEVDARSDIYALGAILYEMVTGEPAFTGDNEFEVMQRVMDGEHASLASVPVRLAGVIQRALSRVPEERFAHCGAFREALTAALRPRPTRSSVKVPAPPASVVADAPKPQRRSPAPVAPTQEAPARASSPPPPTPDPCLVAWPGAQAETRVPLAGTRMLIDPFTGDVSPAPKRRVAKSHALLTRGASGWVIEPHGRSIATLVDGERIRHARPLRGGEEIVVGQYRYRFEAGSV